MNREIDPKNSNSEEVELQSTTQSSESETAQSALSLEATSVQSSTSFESSDSQVESSNVTSLESEEGSSVLPEIQIVKSEESGDLVAAHEQPEKTADQAVELPSSDQTKYIGTESGGQKSVNESASQAKPESRSESEKTEVVVSEKSGDLGAQTISQPAQDSNVSSEAPEVTDKDEHTVSAIPALTEMKVVKSDDVVSSGESDAAASDRSGGSDGKPEPELFSFLLDEAPKSDSPHLISLGEDKFITRKEIAEFRSEGRAEEEVSRLSSESRIEIAKVLNLATAQDLNSASFNIEPGLTSVVETGEVKMTLTPNEFDAARVRILNGNSHIAFPISTAEATQAPNFVKSDSSHRTDKSEVVPASTRNDGAAESSAPELTEMKVVKTDNVVTSGEFQTVSTASESRVNDASDIPIDSPQENKEPELFSSLLADAPVSDSPDLTSLGGERFITKPEVAEFKQMGRSESEVVSLTSRSAIAEELSLTTTSELNAASFNVQPRSTTVVADGDVKMTLSPPEYVAARVRIENSEEPIVVPVSTNSDRVDNAAVKDPSSDRSSEPEVVPVSSNSSGDDRSSEAAIPALSGMKVEQAPESRIVTSKSTDSVERDVSDEPADTASDSSKPALFSSLLTEAPVTNTNSSNAISLGEERFITKQEVASFKETGRTETEVESLGSRSAIAEELSLTTTDELNTAAFNVQPRSTTVVADGDVKMTLSPPEYVAAKVRVDSVGTPDQVPVSTNGGSDRPSDGRSQDSGLPVLAGLKVLKAPESGVAISTSSDSVERDTSDRPVERTNDSSEPALFNTLLNEAPVNNSPDVTSLGEEKFITKPEVAEFKKIGRTETEVVSLTSRSAMAEDLNLVDTDTLNTASFNVQPRSATVIANGDVKMTLSPQEYAAAKVRVDSVRTPVEVPHSTNGGSDRFVEARPETKVPTPSITDSSKPGSFATLLADAPVSERPTNSSIASEAFITKPEIQQFKARGLEEVEVESLTTRTSMAQTLDLASTQDLNTASFNSQPDFTNVVATGDLQMTRTPQEYEAARPRIASIDTRPVAPALTDMKVVRTTEVVDSGESDSVNEGRPQGNMFAGLLNNEITAGSPKAVALAEEKFITKQEVAAFKDRNVGEAEVESMPTRSAVANSLGFASTVALNNASFNSATLPSNRSDSEIATNLPAKPDSGNVSATSSSELITGIRSGILNNTEPVRLNSLPKSKDVNSIERVAQVDELRLTNDKPQNNRSLSLDSVGFESDIVAPAASTKFSVGYQVTEAESVASNNVANFRSGASLMRSSSQQMFANESQITSLIQGKTPFFEGTKSGSKSIIGVESVKVSSIAAKSIGSVNSSNFDYNSVKRVAETVMTLESGKSAVSYHSVKLGLAATNFVPLKSTGVVKIDGVTGQANLDTVFTTATKSSALNSTMNTLAGSIIDTANANANANSQAAKLNGLTKGATTLIGQTDITSVDTSKGTMIGVSKFDGVKLSSTERTMGTTISLTSKTDLTSGVVKVDGKAINLSIDGMINISKFDFSNTTAKSMNTTNGTAVSVTTNTAKGDAAVVSVKGDTNIPGVKADSTTKADSAQVKSVDSVIQTAKSFVNSTTAPAIIAAIKYGEPLPEGMTYENGFVKLTHNGQVLYFPGLRAALKFVEGLGSQVDLDDEEWYVDTLDAEGNSSRVKYIVVPGDTIESICHQRLGDVRYSELLITINRSEIVYRSLNGTKVPFVYPSQVIMLPNRYERKVFRKNFFASNANQQMKIENEFNSQDIGDSTSDSDSNKTVSTPDKLLAKLHKEVVEHYDPKNREKNLAKESQGSLSSQLGITIERVRFAGGKESINLREYKESVGPLSQSRFHEVQEGDSLLTIAKNDTNLGDTRFWKLIARVNGLTTRLDAFGIPCEALVPGQHLLLPDRKQIVEFCLQESIPTPKTESDPNTVVQFSPGDTVITSEVEVKSYSNNCRSTYSSSPASRNDFTINLQFRNGESWQTVTCYQSRNGKTVRNTYTKDGVQSSMVIDLPASVVKEMAYEEFERSWKLRCGLFSLGSKADTKNRIANGEKPVFVADAV